MSENPYGQNPPQQPPQPPQNPYGTGSGETPYGQPAPSEAAPPQPPPPNPYGGQPAPDPYAAPPQQNPYGSAPQTAQQPYGQPYGQQPPPGPLGDGLDMYGRPLGNDERPGGVTAAAWITMVLSGLSLLLYGFITLAMVIAKDDVTREIDKAIRDSNSTSTFSAEDAYGFVIGILLVVTIWCLIAVICGVFVLRRSNAARIVLVISAIVAGLLSLVGIQSVVSAVPLLACIAVVVLLFKRNARDWFAGRRRY
ncbi:MAG: hypothetical protein ABIO16_02255 [Nocardioides sp.]